MIVPELLPYHVYPRNDLREHSTWRYRPQQHGRAREIRDWRAEIVMTSAVFDFKAILNRMERREHTMPAALTDDKTAANYPDHPSTWNLPAFQPTRVSADRKDPGYIQFNTARARRELVHVYLDGVIQPYAVTADASEGWVLRNMLGADGKLYAVGDRIAQETVHGKVELKLVPDWI